jgi:lipid A 3-O-deacylase PagL
MFRYCLRLAIVIFNMLFLGSVYAQDIKSNDGFGIESNFFAAKVIKHSAKFTAPIPTLTTALDVNFVWQTYGKKDWQERRNYPLVGLGVTYTDYGNNQVFGNCVGVYPNIQVRLIRRNRLEWTMRIGDGMGYVTRKYQKTTPVDTINDAIGTHLNDFAVLTSDIRCHINDHWHIQAGVNFTHISNGDTKQPNLGVNTAGTHVGFMYFPTTYRPKRIVREVPKLKNRWLLEMRAGISYKEARAAGSPILPTYMGALYASKRWQSKNKFYGGIDYAFHNDVLAFMRYYDVDHNHQRPESWDGAIFAGNEFLVGRLGLVGQFGYYYHQTYLKFDPVYEKIGANFYLFKTEHGLVKETFVSSMLLTHGFVAELIEFGVGVGL